ncbi:MAG: PsbP-related protein [Candidatus Paceibacterota bacterium]|jgi:hypothetical protein
MTKIQKIIFAILIIGICAGITLYISNTQKNKTANWKTYNNKTYGVSIKYPADWSIKTEVTDGGEISGVPFKQTSVRLMKDSRVLAISLNDGKTNLSGGGIIINNPSNYISFSAINTTISRSIIIEESEIGHQKYLYVCRMRTDSNNVNTSGILCDNPILTNNVYFGINYLLDTDDTSDSSIVKEMDAIVQNISIK